MININKERLPLWKDRSKAQKVLFVLQIFLSVVIIILVLIQIFSKFSMLNIIEPIFGLTMFLLFLQNKKYNKVISYTYLGVSIFVFIISVAVIFDL